MIISEYNFDTTIARYHRDEATGKVGLEIIPASLRNSVLDRRKTLNGLPFIDVMPGDDEWPATAIDSLVQIKLVGDPYTGAFGKGHTMRESPSVDQFAFESQEQNGDVVITRLRRDFELLGLSVKDRCPVLDKDE